MPNKMFQSIVNAMQEAINKPMGVLDDRFTVVACSDLDRIGRVDEDVTRDVLSKAEVVSVNGYTYKSFGDDSLSKYITFIEGNDEITRKCVEVLTVSIEQQKKYYDDKYDKTNFIKNIITENILTGDIPIKAKDLNFDSEANRVCILVKTLDTSSIDISTIEVIHNLFPDRNKDFAININEDTIALVKEVQPEIEQKDIENLASSISDTLTSEFYIPCIIGIGTKVTEIKDLARSYKEAQVAIEVSKVFDTEKIIVSYDNLGIARLVYQLPTTLCEMFLKEVFKKGSIDSLDQETLFTIRRFFENNLNVSETSRKLFVHRNTLVYRLEKIRKITGLDLRDFEDAIVFKVALMVKKYLNEKPVKY